MAVTDASARTKSNEADAPENQNGLLNCLIYVPNIYNGSGTTQTLVWIVEHFERSGIRPILCFERTWQFPGKVRAVSLFPTMLSRIPGAWTRFVPKIFIERVFLRLLKRYSSKDTFVYVWPQPRLALIKAVKRNGFCIFRELINCPGALCVSEVSEARRNAGLPDRPLSNDAAIAEEHEHFQLSDFVTAPNAEVEKALLATGLSSNKIVCTSFGWAAERFPRLAHPPLDTCESQKQENSPLNVLFVGHIGARKGVHYLFEAWQDLPLAVKLQLVGTVDPEMEQIVAQALADNRITHLAYTDGLEQMFGSADVFAFPTVEEGGPQVTLEAAGCGLPVITTPMGAGRLISDGVNGLIIPPHDVDALRDAVLDLYKNPAKRVAFSRRAQDDAKAFTYDKVGVSRAMLFRQKFASFRMASGR